MNSHKPISIDPPRQLTSVEFTILEKLFSANFSGSSELRRQLKHAKVNQECEDCSSIGFSLDPDIVQRAEVVHSVPVEADGFDVDGSKIHFAVIVVDGCIDELQIYREDFKKIFLYRTNMSENQS